MEKESNQEPVSPAHRLVQGFIEGSISEDQIINTLLMTNFPPAKDDLLETIGVYIEEVSKEHFQDSILSQEDQKKYDGQKESAKEKLAALQEKVRKIII